MREVRCVPKICSTGIIGGNDSVNPLMPTAMDNNSEFLIPLTHHVLVSHETLTLGFQLIGADVAFFLSHLFFGFFFVKGIGLMHYELQLQHEEDGEAVTVVAAETA